MAPGAADAAVARSRTSLLLAPALTALAAGAAVGALALRDPHEQGSWGLCPFLLLTGQPCPGCGGLRAVNDLTRLDVVGALSSNALAVVMMVVAGLAWVAWAVRRWRGDDTPLPRVGGRAAAVVLAAVAVFGIVRLTPWGSWLAP